jgi:tetratricopeptide (TPR) repeat protein
MLLPFLIAGLMAGAPPSPLELARDQQDRAALQKLASEAGAAAAKTPNDVDAQLRAALAWSYLAEVAIEQHERKPGRQAAEQGIPFGVKAASLKPDSAEAWRILGTLYGQAITDVLSGLSYGAKAKDALAKAIEKAPRSSAVWTAHGVGNYYLPTQLGGGPELAVADFHKAIDLDSKNAEAWLWLGVALRKQNKDAEARQAFAKALELDPRRVWVKQQLDKTPAK